MQEPMTQKIYHCKSIPIFKLVQIGKMKETCLHAYYKEQGHIMSP